MAGDLPDDVARNALHQKNRRSRVREVVQAEALDSQRPGRGPGTACPCPTGTASSGSAISPSAARWSTPKPKRPFSASTVTRGRGAFFGTPVSALASHRHERGDVQAQSQGVSRRSSAKSSRINDPRTEGALTRESGLPSPLNIEEVRIPFEDLDCKLRGVTHAPSALCLLRGDKRLAARRHRVGGEILSRRALRPSRRHPEVPVLLRMFERRLRGYRSIGYARGEAPLGFAETREVIRVEDDADPPASATEDRARPMLDPRGGQPHDWPCLPSL
jgi:hypothetical protein